jgi:hypothetical protein
MIRNSAKVSKEFSFQVSDLRVYNSLAKETGRTEESAEELEEGGGGEEEEEEEEEEGEEVVKVTEVRDTIVDTDAYHISASKWLPMREPATPP